MPVLTHKRCSSVSSVSAESHSPHGRPPFVHRDDRTSKTYERLQKKLKERQGGGGGGGQVKDSPPPSPQKNCSSPQTVDIHNGFGGKGLDAEQGQLSHAVAGTAKQTGRDKNGESEGKEVKEVRVIKVYSLADTQHFADVRSRLFLDALNSASLDAAAAGRERSVEQPALFLIT